MYDRSQGPVIFLMPDTPAVPTRGRVCRFVWYELYYDVGKLSIEVRSRFRSESSRNLAIQKGAGTTFQRISTCRIQIWGSWEVCSKIDVFACPNMCGCHTWHMARDWKLSAVYNHFELCCLTLFPPVHTTARLLSLTQLPPNCNIIRYGWTNLKSHGVSVGV